MGGQAQPYAGSPTVHHPNARILSLDPDAPLLPGTPNAGAGLAGLLGNSDAMPAPAPSPAPMTAAPGAIPDTRPGHVQTNIFGRMPAPAGGALNLAPGAGTPAAAPGAAARPRSLTLQDVRNTGMMPPQLDAALTPFGTGPGQRLGRQVGEQAWRPPGGLRPLSRQTFYSMDAPHQRALTGTVSALGGRSAAEAYVGNIGRSAGSLRQRL